MGIPRHVWSVHWCAISVVLVLLISGSLQAGSVNTAIYTGYSDNYPNRVHFTGTPMDSISTADFQQFGSAVNWMWYRDAPSAFASDTVRNVQVTTADTFTFALAGGRTNSPLLPRRSLVAY